MLFMIIERFRNGNPGPVYERFETRGRMIPEGVEYINSVVTDDLQTCYQVMKCDDRQLLDIWISNWDDLVDFEVIKVMTSREAHKIVMEPK